MGRSYLVNKFSPHIGDIVIRRSGGDYLSDPDEIREIAKGLLNMASLLESSGGGFDQGVYRQSRASELALEIALLDSSSWVFGGTSEGYRLTDGEIRRGIGVVYFASTSDHPDLIKVGSSNRPLQRMQELSSSMKVSGFTIEALCKTPDYRDLEKYLHYSLTESHFAHELFYKSGVMWLINYIKQLLLDKG